MFYLENASLIWSKLEQRFAQPNDTRVCHLQQRLCSTMQENKIIDAYFFELNGIWEKLKSYRLVPHYLYGKGNDTCFQVFVEVQKKDLVFKFLNGLNDAFQNLRSQIILMSPFPSLNRVYNMVLREETQRSLSLQYHNIQQGSAFVVKQNRFKNAEGIRGSYCDKLGHSKETCYKLHGFPPGFKFTEGKSHVKALVVNSATSNLGGQLNLSKSQVNKLMVLLKEHGGEIKEGGETSGTNQSSFLNMTGHTYRKSIEKAQIGSIMLDNVLLIPTFTFNLISVLSLWNMIGLAEMRGGLYYLS